VPPGSPATFAGGRAGCPTERPARADSLRLAARAGRRLRPPIWLTP